jgi:poly [ADP-ribose] polymerase 2/3/4
VSKPTKNNNNLQSKMDAGLQKLINLIFDVNIMNNTMKEIGYDAKKMPLGRLGDSTIKEAYGVLNKLSEAIKKKDRNLMSSLSGDFYSLIPHDFGFSKMSNFILDNDEKVKEKLKMLETISDLKITSKLLDKKTDDNEAILDQNYKKLGCSIKTVD